MCGLLAQRALIGNENGFLHTHLDVVLFTPLPWRLAFAVSYSSREENTQQDARNVFGTLGFLVSASAASLVQPEWGGAPLRKRRLIPSLARIPSRHRRHHLLLVHASTFLFSVMIAILSSWSAIHLRTQGILHFRLLLLLQTWDDCSFRFLSISSCSTVFWK